MSVWSYATKNAATWANSAKNAATWVYDAVRGFLLTEAGGFILLETGGRIIIAGEGDSAWTHQTKN